MRTLLLALGCSTLLCACASRSEPPYPKDAVGWSNYKEGTTKFRGRFVLRAGESTDNGMIRVKAVELLPPRFTGDAGDFEARARVRLAFISVSDEKVLCWDDFPDTGGGSVPLPVEYKIFDVGVRAINLSEGWVYFVLTGDY